MGFDISLFKFLADFDDSIKKFHCIGFRALDNFDILRSVFTLLLCIF